MKKLLKRILSLTLIGLMVIPLSACGSSNDEDALNIYVFGQSMFQIQLLRLLKKKQVLK